MFLASRYQHGKQCTHYVSAGYQNLRLEQTAQSDQLNALRQYSCVRYYCTIVYFRNCLLLIILAGLKYTLSALSMDGSAVLAAIFWLVPCGPCGRRDCSAYGGSLGGVRPV